MVLTFVFFCAFGFDGGQYFLQNIKVGISAKIEIVKHFIEVFALEFEFLRKDVFHFLFDLFVIYIKS